MIEVIHTSNPVARKAHTCQVCFTTIEPGTRYRRSVNRMDSVYTWIEHEECGLVGMESLDAWGDEGYTDDSVHAYLEDMAGGELTELQRIVWDRIQSRMQPTDTAAEVRT